MTDIKAGDEVRVFDVNGRRMGQPDGGWTGHVTKVGRTLVHIEYRAGRPEAFRLDSQRRNDSMGHRSFRTLEQANRDARKEVASDVLRKHGIALGFGVRTLTLEQIEALAEVARTFGEA